MPVHKTAASARVIAFYDYRLDRDLRRLQHQSEQLKLSPKLFQTLEFLVINHHRVVTKAQLLEQIWAGENPVPNVVEQVVAKLRRLLADERENPKFIETAAGGYRFIAPLSFAEPEPSADSEPIAPHSANAPPSIPLAAHDPEPSPPRIWPLGRRPRLFLVAASLFMFVSLGVFLYAMAPGEPAACEVSVDTLIAKDGQGRPVWRREFKEHLNQLFYAQHPPLCRFVDLNHDRVADLLFVTRAANPDLESDALYGFVTPPRFFRALHIAPLYVSTYQPGAHLVVGPNGDPKIKRQYDEYLPPYDIENVFSEGRQGGGARIVVSSGMGQAPDQITVLDESFQKLGEYWHTGVLKYGQFAKYDGNDRLFLGGVDNGYRSATLIAFDPDHVSGTTDLSLNLPDRMPGFAILATGSRGRLQAPGSGTETCRVLFERTDIAKAKPHREPYNRLVSLRVTDDRIFVTVAESEHEEIPERVVYELDRHMNLVEVGPTTAFRQRHMEMERAGLLDHALSIEELKPLVHVLRGCEFAGNAAPE